VASGATDRRVSSDEQLERWVAGESVHNAERNECCPDFSCCRPTLLAPDWERQAFKAASERARSGMLMTFLGRMLADADVGRVHIVGDDGDLDVGTGP
jgi:hypothetical protein